MGNNINLVSNSENVLIGDVNAGGNVCIGGTIVQYNMFPEYENLQKQIERNKDYLNMLNTTSQSEKRENVIKDIEELENEKQAFISGIFRMADIFNNMEISSERLQKALEYFKEGKIKEADAILKTEDMYKDKHNVLIGRKIAEKNCEKLSDEFLVKAKLTALKFENPNRFDEACQYYKDSIKISPRFENIFENALYLKQHNQNKEALFSFELLKSNLLNDLNVSLMAKAMILTDIAWFQRDMSENKEAERTYQEVLIMYRELTQKSPETYTVALAMTLKNLANLQENMNEIKKAEKNYEKALMKYRELAEKNPGKYNQDVAEILNRIALLQRCYMNEIKKVEKKDEEALMKYRDLAEKNPEKYNQDVAERLNRIASLQCYMNENKKAEENYEEALGKYKRLVEKDPGAYILDVVKTLDKLTVLQNKMNENRKAEKNYEEVLTMYRRLAEKNPETYTQYVVSILVYSSMFYLKVLKNINKAKDLCLEALNIINQFVDCGSLASTYKAICLEILRICGVDLEDRE